MTDSPAPRGQGRTLLVGGGIGLVILLLVVAALTRSGDGVVDQPSAGPTPGFGLTDAADSLPDATLGGFAGGPEVAVADLLGGAPVIVNFWATWCPPCVAEMPDLQALHEAGDGAFRMVGINTQDAAVNAEAFIAELGVTYEQAVDIDGSYFTATGGFGMPTTLFVRPDGRITFRQTGPMTLSQMQDLLAEHLDVRVDAEAAWGRRGWLDQRTSG